MSHTRAHKKVPAMQIEKCVSKDEVEPEMFGASGYSLTNRVTSVVCIMNMPHTLFAMKLIKRLLKFKFLKRRNSRAACRTTKMLQ